MVSSTIYATSATSQPEFYDHMEQTLSKEISKTEGDTYELTGGRSNSNLQTSCAGMDLYKIGDIAVTNSPQHDSDTKKLDNPMHSSSNSDAPIGSSSTFCEMPVKECSSAPGASQAESSPKASSASSSPCSEESDSKTTESRPLVPPPIAISPGLQQAPAASLFEQSSIPNLEGMSKVSITPGPPLVMQNSGAKSPSDSPMSTSPTNIQGFSTKPKSGSSLRRGKWTVEEETYVARVIQDFNSGFLNAPAGTTLRSYLSDKLQCDPMRITKKFTGDACIGKRVFHPAVRNTANAAVIDKAQAELDTLERRWRRRLEMQQRESAKKAAASAAAVAHSDGRADQTMVQGVPIALLSEVGQSSCSDTRHSGQSVVTQAASWLDRANAILKGGHLDISPDAATDLGSTNQTEGESIDSMPYSEIESQMMEVQRLIFEGPRIQQTAAGLPNLLSTNPRPSSVFEGPPTPPEPADKRMRTGGTITGAEDAEALVGFLRSVRASAAGGSDSS